MENKTSYYGSSLEQELLELSQKMDDQKKKEITRKKRAEGGKLGGRPKAKIERKKQVNVGLSVNEYSKLSAVAEAHKITIPELFRRSAFQVPMPDSERNKMLVEYRVNFSRISNIFRRDIWDQEEKNKFRKELNEVILQIRNFISNKW